MFLLPRQQRIDRLVKNTCVFCFVLVLFNAATFAVIEADARSPLAGTVKYTAPGRAEPVKADCGVDVAETPDRRRKATPSLASLPHLQPPLPGAAPAVSRTVEGGETRGAGKRRCRWWIG